MSAQHHHNIRILSEENKYELEKYRKARNFNPEKYANAKAILLNNYLKKHNINTVMVALSGGIDSAVVLGLLVHASKQPNSPIKKVVGINIPIFSTGVSCNQEITLEKSLELKKCFPEIEFRSLDLSAPFNAMVNTIASTVQIDTSNWASGQLVSNIRAPAIYFANALNFKNENNAVVCGTINRDEGAYVGYFGKVSDSVVDLQLIFDIHKSEVNNLAAYFQIPDSILKARPTGDVYNGQCDEDFLEVSYDFIELYAAYLCNSVTPTLDDAWLSQAAKMEYHHNKCIHKYYMPGIAVNLDVYDHNVPQNKPTFNLTMDSLEQFINCKNLKYKLNHTSQSTSVVTTLEGSALITNLLSDSETSELNVLINKQAWVFTDKHGKIHPQSNELALKSEPGSYRLSWYNTDFAETLYNRLKPHLDILLLSQEEVNQNADYENCQVWRPVGINPYMRFIKYNNNDSLVPHYDSPYAYNSTTKTLKSVVIYLTSTTSGSTCFIKEKPDAQGYEDWQNNECPEDITAKINCVSGSALVFNHRMLHSAAPVLNEEKIIIRTDVIYEKCYPTTTTTYSTEPLGLVSSKQTTYSDTYYASASQFYTHEELLAAGYLTTVPKSLPINFNYMGTPYHKLQIKTKKPSVILLSTGCFNPIHIGHIKMLEHAKHYVETSMNAEVIGGYFSIANATYHEYKQQKPINIVDVIKSCDTTLADYDWLMVDPYAALYESTDLNFTVIIDRLEKYIKYQNINAQIVYVFGGDNAAFARAFRAKGTAICVNRPGCEPTFNKVRAEFTDLKTQVHFLDIYTENISSTMIRNKNLQPSPKVRPTGNYIINEDSYCESNPLMPKSSLITFNANLVKLFEKYTNQQLNKIVLNKCQLEVATAQTPHTPPEISLNPYYITDYNLQVSTLYAAAAYKTRLNLVARPGSYKTIQQQVEAIPPDTYTLVDDDTYSGYTMNKIQEILQNTHVKTANIKFTNTHVAEDNIYDIVDCRDLHIGRENGGAVIRLPNKTICRAPYILPYCFPSAKCSISTEYDLQYSLDVWKLNHAYYRPTSITLRDVDQNTQLLFLASGFVLDHPMSYICRCHIMYLEH